MDDIHGKYPWKTEDSGIRDADAQLLRQDKMCFKAMKAIFVPEGTGLHGFFCLKNETMVPAGWLSMSAGPKSDAEKDGREMMETKELLQKIKEGSLSVEEGEKLLRRQPFEDMGYAKIDTHRKIRSGFAEVIFCSGKADEHLMSIYERIYREEGEVFGTRASREQYEMIKKSFPETVYDPISKIIKIEKEGKKKIGNIAVCTAGTADIAVAEEAAQTAEFFGSKVSRIYDVGVSGIHRLLARLDVIQEANCVIAVAGMEGALASVLGGLVDKPVIAVPTSVGYGASMHGLAALLTMINSCANGISVVNIDNGYGAGYIATQINRLGCRE